jgi:hypothetical protein
MSNQAAYITGCWLASLAAKQHLAIPIAITFLVIITGLIKTLLVAVRLIVKPTRYSTVTLI